MNDVQIHLADIAGYHEEKEEAVKLIDMLQNFALYKAKAFILKWQDLGRMIFPILKEKQDVCLSLTNR